MNIQKSQLILDYWFPKNGKADYDKWFMKSSDYDSEIKEKFHNILKEAEDGKGFEWLISKNSYLAHIILMDQFSRHIYRGKGESFKNDKGNLIFTELGIDIYIEDLNNYELMFAFMPYMHTEIKMYQNKGLEIFKRMNNIQKYKLLNPNLTDKEKEQCKQNLKILNDMKVYVDLHHDVIERFGRFPKRNILLNRTSTPEEIQYINNEAKDRPF
jgi:uncharacterized protein (DUF924 family)